MSSVLNRGWNVAEENASGGELKLRGV